MTASTTFETPQTPAGHATAARSAAERAYAEERIEWRALQVAAALFFGAALVFAGLFYAQDDQFYLRLATEALIYGGLAISVDILLGQAGLLSLGQALYFGLGAYVSALVMKNVAPSFWLALGASLGIGIVAGLIGGLIAIRARGVYFALITYGLAAVIGKVIYNTRELGASDGIIGIPIVNVPLGFVETPADSPVGFFLVTLAIVGIIYLGLVYVGSTPFGRALAGVRINESRLPFLGYRPFRLKLGAFVMAAAIASLMGGLYPMLRSFVSPELMYFDVSTNAVIAAMIGGVGTVIGPLYGAVFLVYVKSAIGTFTEHHLIVIGALFMAVVIFFPRGVIGYGKELVVRIVRQRRGASGDMPDGGGPA
jgi:branched-chain amino acid transport system permease protein